MALLPGQVLVNRYRIVKLVGQGGFGAVYRAWDTALHVPVAVKENLDISPEAQHQFEREALLLAPLRHTNLPRVTDHFFLPGQGQYLVMDFVEGRNLEELLNERGHALDEAEVLPWIGQVCDALDYLHRQTPPIIHRDIKPQNIIIDAGDRAMLVDFGISKVYDPSLVTTVGARAVTIGFSPPEQYGMGKTDARSDVYALGATLYTLLTGTPPPESVGLMTGAETLTPIRQTNPNVSPSTEAAITAAMALATSQRLSGAGALRDALAGKAIAPLPAVGRTVGLSEASEGRAASVWMPAVVGLAVVVVITVAAYFLLRDRNHQTVNVPTTGVATAVATTDGTGATDVAVTEPPVTPERAVVATKTAEPTATAEPTVSASPPTLERPTPTAPAETPPKVIFTRPGAAEWDETPSVWGRIEFRDRQRPGTEVYSLTVNPREPLRWSFSWCAINSTLLDEILAPLNVAMGVDGTPLPSEFVLEHEVVESSGWVCRYWSTLMNDWRSGETVELAIEYTIVDDIFDGVDTYFRGDYSQVIFVEVR